MRFPHPQQFTLNLLSVYSQFTLNVLTIHSQFTLNASRPLQKRDASLKLGATPHREKVSPLLSNSKRREASLTILLHPYLHLHRAPQMKKTRTKKRERKDASGKTRAKKREWKEAAHKAARDAVREVHPFSSQAVSQVNRFE
jgi:hypothetical protein